jgi:hypothetical protein
VIVVVEGPSAAGKTTWIAAHRGEAAVIPEAESGQAPRSANDLVESAAHWAQVSADRWAKATQAERQYDLVLCDTDPFKLHYAWCRWQSGNAAIGEWRAAMDAHRQLFAGHRLGIADLILVSIPDQATLAARRERDHTRGRRNFRLHAQLTEPLRDWYTAISQLDSDRVQWALPATGVPDLSAAGSRAPRTGTGLFNALMELLPAR